MRFFPRLFTRSGSMDMSRDARQRRTSTRRRGRRFGFEALEDRRVLATATMLEQEFELPFWLTPAQVEAAQDAVAEITNTAGDGLAYAETTQSYDLIGVEDYMENSGLSDFDGSGYSIAILDTGADLDHSAFGPSTGGVADRIVYHEDFVNDDSDA